MARNRVIYQSQAVYVSQDINPTGIATGSRTAGGGRLNDHADLNRIQSCNYTFSIGRQDVNQFGELAAIDRIITETPTVSLEGSYLVANLGNEKKLGFDIFAGPKDPVSTTPVSCISGLIDTETNQGVKNYYILTTKEGSDAIDNTKSGNYESIIGIGNASLTSYSTEGAVGGLPTASFTIEGQNLNAVNTPYTGMYSNYTGLNAPGSTASAVYNPARINGYGFVTAQGDNKILVQPTGTPVTYAAGNVTIPITTGNRLSHAVKYPAGTIVPTDQAGAQSTIPAGKVLNYCEDDGNSTATFTLTKPLEKGSQQMVGTLSSDVVIPAGRLGPAFTGSFGDVIVAVSGSNPSIDTTDGGQIEWNAFSGGASAAGTLLKKEVGKDFSNNPAPITLPVSTTNLNPNDVNVTGAISTLRPGDITISLKKSSGAEEDLPGAKVSNAHIQSYNISFDLARTPIQRLGNRFAFARPIDFPISASFSFDAILADLTTGTISDLIDCDEDYEATVFLKNVPDCNKPKIKETVMSYTMKKLKLESQSFSSSIGDNKTVSLDFSCQIGAPEQSDVGVFMSGYSAEQNAS